ncbi:MAG: DUF4292 domain-containing protein [Saprospiraceae bacterium]
MRFVVFFLVVFMVNGCRTIKKLPPLPPRSKEEVVQTLLKRNIDFQWFSGKMSTSIESPDENASGSMIVRMKKDSAILVAVKKFGVEFARLFVDKESYTIIYRFDSAYETGPIAQINDIITISADYTDLQELMFGNVVLPDGNDIAFDKDSIYYTLKTQVDDIHLEYFVNGYTLELDKLKITDKMSRVATAIYSDYKVVEGFGKIAYDRTFYFPYSASETATIQMRFSDIEINVPKDLKFSIPDRYEKIN